MMFTRLVRIACAAASVALIVWAGGGAVLAATKPPPNWAMFGFECVCVLAASFGVLIAIGKLKDTPAMSLAVIAGTVFVCAVLTSLGYDRSIVPMSRKLWVLARIALAMVFAGSAVVHGLGSSAAAWRSMITAAVWAVPLAAAALLHRTGRLSVLTAPRVGTAETVRLIGLTVAGVFAIICVCAAGHFAIRAFELARSNPRTITRV